jgi:DNA-binding SARP family transcriptional activator/TolB-like protein
MAVRLQTLGRHVLVKDGAASTSLGSQPVRAAFLVHLAVERETTREKVSGLLWPDRDARRARHALSQTLYQLRSDFGDGLILADRARLRATPELEVDAFDFVRAVERDDVETAVALYAGPFLSGHRLVETQAFEMWVDLQRARLERLNRRARRLHIRGFVNAGNTEAAMNAARAWADLDPFEDEAQHQLIGLLASTGDFDEALRRYDDYQRLLAAEDLSPLDETTTLIESIRRKREGASGRESTPGSAVQSPARNAGELETAVAPVPTGTRETGAWQRRSLPMRSILLAAVLVMIGGAGAVALLDRADSGRLIGDRVLVVPFDNETGDSALAPIGDMAADWISQGLARIGRLQVIPTVELLGMTGARPEPGLARGGTATALGAARQARAGIVVSGRYYTRADRLELYAQISDVASGELVVALDPVTSGVANPGSAIEDVGRRIMGSLAARFSSDVPLEPPSVIHPPTYDAFVTYQEGTRLFSHGEFAASIPYFLQATRLDPDFVRPLLTAASAWGNLGDAARQDSMLDVVGLRARALAPYERAHLEWARADLHGDLDAAWEAARRLVRLAPGGPANYVHGAQALEDGRPRDAIDIFADLDPAPDWAPDWWNSWEYITAGYHALGEHQRELKVIRTVMRDDSRLRMRVLELRALAALGRVDDVLDRLDQAMSGLDEARLDFGDVLARTAVELQAHGNGAAADPLLERAVRWCAIPGRPMTPRQQWRRVRVLTATGRYDDAESLLQSLRTGSPASIDFCGYSGVIAARRGDRRGALAIDDSLSRSIGRYDLGRSVYWQAAIRAWLGEPDAALGLLREARTRGRPLGFDLHADDDLRPLWDLPEYAALVVVRD